MQLHVFTGPEAHHGFTADRAGANLPPDLGPWAYSKTIDLNRGKTARWVVDIDEALDALERDGYFIVILRGSITVR
jgi:hypothetical protein